MSKVAMVTEVSIERCLLDMPYEICFEIFRRLPKDKLIEISRFSSKFRDVAGDTRLWKDVYIKYRKKFVAFEELYSGPWPVKVIDLRKTEIKPPVSSKTNQVVKVNKLDLSMITANKVTMEAILAKYQCTELSLNTNSVDVQGRIMGIEPEAFSRQTDLEVLLLVTIDSIHRDVKTKKFIKLPCRLWLAPVLSNCKNLKVLNLNHNDMRNDDLLGFVRNLPTSLEKLFIVTALPKDSFFKLLAESTPNLRELALSSTRAVKCPSLLELQFLEVVYCYRAINISDLSMYLIKFPALKGFYIGRHPHLRYYQETTLANHLTTLEPRGIIVGALRLQESSPYHPKDGNLWEVSKAT